MGSVFLAEIEFGAKCELGAKWRGRWYNGLEGVCVEVLKEFFADPKVLPLFADKNIFKTPITLFAQHNDRQIARKIIALGVTEPRPSIALLYKAPDNQVIENKVPVHTALAICHQRGTLAVIVGVVREYVLDQVKKDLH